MRYDQGDENMTIHEVIPDEKVTAQLIRFSED
jgi:hypothetical protein